MKHPTRRITDRTEAARAQHARWVRERERADAFIAHNEAVAHEAGMTANTPRFLEHREIVSALKEEREASTVAIARAKSWL